MRSIALITFAFVVMVFSNAIAQDDRQTIEQALNQADEKKQVEIYLLFANKYIRTQPNKAIEYAGEAISILKKLEPTDKKLYAQAYKILGDSYIAFADKTEAVKYYEQELDYLDTTNIAEYYMQAHNRLGILYSQLEKRRKAIDHFETGLKKARAINSTIHIRDFNRMLYHEYKMLKNYKEALEAYESYIARIYQIRKDSIELLEKEKEEQVIKLLMKDMALYEAGLDARQMAHEDSIKKAQIETLELKKQFDEQKIRQQRILIFLFIGVIFIIATYTIWVIRLLRQKRRAHKTLEIQKNEIEAHKEEIETQAENLDQSNKQLEKQNNQMLDSIRYAKHIQSAMLVDEPEIHNCLSDVFVFYAPKDIVSGDFYWFTKINNNIIISAVDCAGHGVPGAFMSIIGSTLLDKIVKVDKVIEPDNILLNLHNEMLTTLHKLNKENRSDDAMDMALCRIDMENKKLYFAGAFNSLIVADNTELLEFEGSYQSVGKVPLRQDKQIAFHLQEAPFNTEATYYMFTDGYLDQFGGEENKKLGSKRFKELLQQITTKPVAEQKTAVVDAFNEWKGNRKQTDDVLIVGFRIND